MIDSVNRKDENYDPKVFLEKFVHNFFWNFGLWNFLELVAIRFQFQKYEKHFKSGLFLFFELQNFCFLIALYKTFFRVSISLNIRKFHFLKHNKFFGGLHFPKYKKSFLLRKYQKFLNIRARNSISQNTRKYKNFF